MSTVINGSDNFNTNDVTVDSRKPVFSLRQSSSLGGSYSQYITFNTVEIDTHSGYDAATGRWYAPIKGYYQVNVFNNMINPNTADTMLYKNSTHIGGTEHDNASTNGKWDGRGFSKIVLLDVGDYLAVRVSGSAAIDTYWEGGGWNGFTGFLISEVA